jgi:hypothetical protein
MKASLTVLSLLLSQYAFAQQDFGTLSCKTTFMTLKKGDGSRQNIPVSSDTKTFLIKQDGNRLIAIYPGGPDTAFHGAIFVRASTETVDGAATYIRRFERRTSDMNYAVDVAKNAKTSGYTMMTQSVMQGSPNVLIGVHNCQ